VRITRCGAAALAAAVLAGCASGRIDPRHHAQVRADLPESAAGVVQVRFLGVQGFVVRRGADVVMTAPLYTNPSLATVLAGGRIWPDRRRITTYLPREWVSDVAAILVGHSHYDHLMDVPFIAHGMAPRATVYGSLTTRKLVAAIGTEPDFFVAPDRVVAVNDAAQPGGDAVDYRECPRKPKEGCIWGSGPGRWLAVAADVRIRALCSRHSPQFLRFPPTWQGCDAPAQGPPRKPSQWPIGDTLAYLIDFLDGGRPVFRVYYQDSPTEREFGHVARELIEEKAVDLALLNAGGFNQVDGFPESIIATLRPRYVLYGHWEDFLRPQEQPLRPLWMYDFSELARRTEGLGPAFWFPAPGQLFVFPVVAGPAAAAP
jgi:hypothetical protein